MRWLSPALGPSPRVRGRDMWRVAASHISRAIPARAGERRGGSGPASASIGPSPRVRGRVWLPATDPAVGHPARGGRRRQSVTGRAIPARAGESGPADLSSPFPAGHPRACGGEARRRMGMEQRTGHPRACGERLVCKVLILHKNYRLPLLYRPNPSGKHQAAAPGPGGSNPLTQAHCKRCRIRDFQDAGHVRDRDQRGAIRSPYALLPIGVEGQSFELIAAARPETPKPVASSVVTTSCRSCAARLGQSRQRLEDRVAFDGAPVGALATHNR